MQGHGRPRVFTTWERCQLHARGQVCEEPEIVLTHSDDFGAIWSPPRVISAGGDNYFPFVAADRAPGRSRRPGTPTASIRSSTTAKTSNWPGSGRVGS